MEISPQGKDAIKGTLCQFMSDDEAERFIDLEYAMDVIKQGQLCWQAPVSIGIHAAELYLNAKGDGDSAALLDLIGVSLEPLEALLQFLSAVPDEETLTDEPARTLFYSRFALGLLRLAKGEKQRAKVLLHAVAGTKVSHRGGEISSGRGIVWCSTDIAEAKWHTAWYLVVECMRQEDKSYEELVYAIAEAAACKSVLGAGTALVITTVAFFILDKWTAECSKTDASQEYDLPDFGWLDLFTGASEVLSFCPEPDTDRDLPNECAAGSPQYAAWKFGQIAGRFAVEDPRWSKNPHEKINEVYEAFAAGNLFTWGEEQSYQAFCAVAALLTEFDAERDWPKARQRYIEMWRRSDRWSGAVLSEISPTTDLYWAIRIGFADTILETSARQALVPTEISPQAGVPDVGGQSGDNFNAALRLLRIDRQTQNLPGIVEGLFLKYLSPGKPDTHDQRAEASDILGRLEPDLRKFIETKLREFYGDGWWKQGVHEKVRTDCEARKRSKEKPSGPSYHPIYYAYLNDCKEIILKGDNWNKLFHAIFANKSEVETCFSWVVPVRDAFAHTRPFSEHDLLLFRAAALQLQSDITRIIDPGP